MKRFFKNFALLTVLAVMFAALSLTAYAGDPDPVDMSLIFSSETQLTVYVNGEWSSALSDICGYGESVSLTAPEVAGKSFSHWEADGSVISYENPLKLTVNANTEIFAVYANTAPTAKPVAGFTSITRSTDGEQIVLQAKASGETAGFVYSTTATGTNLIIDGTDVTNIPAVKLDDNITAIPQSALDDNSCYMLKITPTDANTVYHVRAYVTDGGEPAYGDVKDVKLSELPDGVSMIANLEGFEEGIDDKLAGLTDNMLTVTFDANGGVGATIIQAAPGGSVTLRANTFTREGYSFKGWSTTPSGSASYSNGQTVTLNDNITLYAVWDNGSSGNTGGGSSSASTTVTVPVSGEDATVNVQVEVKDKTATIKNADVDKVLDAKDVGTVTIDVSGLNKTIDEAVIPGAMVEKIAAAVADEKNDADGLEIKLSTGTVELDKETVKAVSEQANGKDITLHLDNVKVTELNSAQQGAVQKLEIEVILDAYITSGNERITDFKGGSATVSIPYALKDNQSSLGIVVYYVDSNGKTTEINARYIGQHVVFEVPHFSNYVIAYDAERAKECPKDSTCPMSAFKDLNKLAWYHDGIHFCLANGMMNGTGNGKFEPEAGATRAMIVTMLWRLEGSPVVNYAMNYSDVAADSWYTEAVRWASSENIVTGYDGKFDPNDAVIREQLVTILYRYAKYKNMDVSKSASLNSFADSKTVRSYAVDAMKWAVGNGIINGEPYKENVFLVPGGASSRAVVATMFSRFCQ